MNKTETVRQLEKKVDEIIAHRGAMRIIEVAITSPEFIETMMVALDFFDTIVKAYNTENIVILKGVVRALERRIAEINIKNWFEHLE